MTRPPLEVADIVRSTGPSFLERNRQWINGQHQKVLSAIMRCRTAAWGGHRDQCSSCGHSAISYNSCRNRHCPRCQGNARLRWLQARERELLPTPYVHVVFTLPRELAPLALQNKRRVYSLLFHAVAETLLEIARDPRHLGADIGFFSVLHTWDQRLQYHPHVHCVVAAGGLAPQHDRWISSRQSFFLPVKVLSRVFRGKFVAALKVAFRGGELEFHGRLAALAEPRAFASWRRSLVPPRLGGLLQAAVRWSATRSPLPWRLHPPRCHLQPSTDCPRKRQGHVSMEGLCPRQPQADHEPLGRRVPTPLSPPPVTARLYAHPQLRLPRQSATSPASSTVFSIAAVRAGLDTACCIVGSLGTLALELSCLWRNHAAR